MHIIRMGLPALLGGAVLAVAEYFLAKWVLKHHAQHYAAVSVIRQLLNVGYLAALFFLGRGDTQGLVPLLVGGALGLTVPAAFLTAALLKSVPQNDEKKGDDRNDG